MKKILILTALLGFVIALAFLSPPKQESIDYLRFHDPEQLRTALQQITTPIDSGEYFLTPANCKGCHGKDLQGLANVDGLGQDVNLFDSWETSMMGLAAMDPLWRAKVRHEILVNPSHTNELPTFCTRCHAPMGRYTAMFHGMQHYTLADLDTDSLGLSGVACGGCHSISPNGLGSMFTGHIPYDTTRIEYGPFVNPFTGPMQLYIGMTPAFSLHMDEGKVCSPCHTLISNTVDLNGVPTGGEFVEQATFHEWVNSAFPDQNIKCQTCHMPQIEDPIKIANGYTSLTARSPFNKHIFAGANAFMVNLIKQNKSKIGVTASDVNFDSTLANINRQLRYNSDSVSAIVDTILNDTLFVSVKVFNKTGHKFPSGYPSRRAVLQFVAVKSNGDTLFASGLFDSTKEVIGIDSVFEPHYTMINSPAQTQIYEMVMGDVNGNKTTVLERAAAQLKDNRIPPVGFTTTHINYDTCRIVGNATGDPDFNRDGSTEGTGADRVQYHIPLNGYRGLLSVYSGVYYQLLPPGWLKEMFQHSAAEIDSFKTMYNTADKDPILTGGDTLLNLNTATGILAPLLNQVVLSPNPTSTGRVLLTVPDGRLIRVEGYDLNGQQIVLSIQPTSASSFALLLPQKAGVYLLKITTNKGTTLHKVIRL